MSFRRTYTCDVCGKQKGEVNHWWIADSTGNGFTVRAWEDTLSNVIHLCGHDCLNVLLSRWMDQVRVRT